jgi:proteasome accessory factor A
MFMEEEGLGWDDPWLKSLDLEYHNLDPARGLYYSLREQHGIEPVVSRARVEYATTNPPTTTRAQARGIAVRALRGRAKTRSYIINWDSVAVEDRDPLIMGNPFYSYTDEVAELLAGGQTRD